MTHVETEGAEDRGFFFPDASLFPRVRVLNYIILSILQK